MNQRIQLSDHFTTSRILRFAASPIIMMVFTSIYSVVGRKGNVNFSIGLCRAWSRRYACGTKTKENRISCV